MEWIDCEECNGTGEILYDISVPMSASVASGFIDSEWGDCELCNGVGSLEREEDEYSHE